MIQGEFQRMIRPKSKGFSGGQFRFGIEALDAATRQVPFGAEPGQQQLTMPSQHAGDLLHRGELRAQGSRTSGVQKLSGPIRRRIRPEKLEVLLQQGTPHRAEIVVPQLGQPDFRLFTQIFRALQEQPPGLRRDRLIALGRERPRFLRAPFVDCLVQMGHDVEPIQDMEGLAGLFRNHAQVRLPRVTPDRVQPVAPLGADPAEEPQERPDGSLFSHPQQPRARGVTLVHQGQVLMPPLPWDLIDADGSDTSQVHVRPPQATASSTERKTWSHLVGKASATAVQLTRLAHLAKNQA